MVQRIATPPTLDAMMISTVNVVLLVFVEAEAAAAEEEAEAAVDSAVRVTVAFPPFVAVTGLEVRSRACEDWGATGVVSDVVGNEVEVEVAIADDLEDEALVELLELMDATDKSEEDADTGVDTVGTEESLAS
jgi:hypothetical protein